MKTMTAKEFLESNGIKYDHEATGMSTYVQNAGSTINAMEQMLEEYHQAKLKLLGIADVVGQSKQLVCDCKNCKPFPNHAAGFRKNKTCINDKAN